jgi:LysM repeat protein
MAITNAIAAKMNKMNRAAQDAVLGTAFQTAQTDIATLQGAIKTGSYAMIAADATAGTKTIATGLGKAITGFIVQIYRSNVLVSGATTTVSTANLIIATNGSTYVVTAGDVVKYIVF